MSHNAESGLLIPSHWNPHWNYRLGGEPRSICACPDGPYEGARLVTIPRFCERCGGLVSDTAPAEKDAALRDLATEFRRRADPSTTGIWREACDLLDQIVSERTRVYPPGAPTGGEA